MEMDRRTFHVEAAATAIVHAVMVTLEKDFNFTDHQKKQFEQLFTGHLKNINATFNRELKESGWAG